MAKWTEFDQRSPKIWEHSRNDRLHFFKYMSCATAQLVLRNNTLRWSTPGCLNDPFDMQFDFRMKIDRDYVVPRALANLWSISQGEVEPGDGKLSNLVLEWGKVKPRTHDEFVALMYPTLLRSIEKMEVLLPELNAGLKLNATKDKVLCLTDRPNTASMWNHYGDAHRGVVLRLRSIVAFDSPYASAIPINYVPEVPDLQNSDEVVSFFSGLRSLDKDRILHDLVYTKSDDWKAEREWRCYSGAGRNKTAQPEDVPFNRHELDGLIFGKDCPHQDRDALKLLSAEYPNVELFEARAEGGFGIDIVSI